jgi:hypothetical protein
VKYSVINNLGFDSSTSHCINLVMQPLIFKFAETSN